MSYLLHQGAHLKCIALVDQELLPLCAVIHLLGVIADLLEKTYTYARAEGLLYAGRDVRS